eukprot:766408-Hanusia_phi.AAC.6
MHEEIIVSSPHCFPTLYCIPAPMHVFDNFFGSNSIIATVSTRSNLIVEYDFCTQETNAKCKWIDDYERMCHPGKPALSNNFPITKANRSCEINDEICCLKSGSNTVVTSYVMTNGWSVSGMRTMRSGCWEDLVFDFEI